MTTPSSGQDDEIPTGAAYRIRLPEFEGPLDLLLHLCKTHEIDIVNIPIAFVTEQYLLYLDALEAVSVDIAAEYLVMAAHLAYLKSRELVPSPEPPEAVSGEEESGLDPKEELIRRLLLYQKYKDAAAQLGGRPIEGRNVFLRGMSMQDGAGETVLAEHSAWKLIGHFADLLKKAGRNAAVHDVTADRMSISDRINQIIDRLEAGGGSFRFDSLVDMNLNEFDLRQQLVVTLLAILELAKLRAIRVLQDPKTEIFFITTSAEASLAGARQIQVTSDVAEVTDETVQPSKESHETP